MTLTTVDWVIIAVILISMSLSLMRGFVKEAIALVTWIVSVMVAMIFYPGMSVILEPAIQSHGGRVMAAIALLFIGTMIVGHIVGRLMHKLIKTAGLTGVDRAIGSVFGFARGILMVVIAVGILKSTGLTQNFSWWSSSLLIPHLALFEDWARNMAHLLSFSLVSLT
jgi:membrane protein required for colicin V production